ncbi:acyl-CoA dehydrogenase family protein [Nocardia sp. NPDC057668]|uniref:acyl-CoA dehydrogenase family protein n=1 Tax=Nocardia sp. NPDC057668 TaxID=3346202 RepID=UPI003671A823
MVPATEFAELHGELRQVARDLLGRSDPARAVDWATMARAGWLGLEVGVEYDGAAATFTEVAVLLGEIGRAAACTAYPGVAALGLGALLAVAPDPDRDHLLAESVSGAAVPVTVLDSRNMTAAKPTFHLAGGHLRGDADLVLDAPLATHLLVPAFTRDGSRVLAMVIPGTPGLTVSARPAVDHTRRLGRVHADNVRAAAVWDLVPDPRTALGHLHDRAALATACDSLGISEAMLEATVAYTKVRHQFGCPIGTFQAVQHACADMLVDITVARQLLAAAIRAMATNDPGTPTAVSMAKSHTTAAAVRIAGKAMQLHGGIGYTWEHNLHTYLKRATLNRSLFGSPAAHRRRLATRYLDR